MLRHFRARLNANGRDAEAQLSWRPLSAGCTINSSWCGAGSRGPKPGELAGRRFMLMRVLQYGCRDQERLQTVDVYVARCTRTRIASNATTSYRARTNVAQAAE